MTTLSQSAFAEKIGKSRQYISKLKNQGLIVMDGDQVDVEASMARMEALKDPSKQGVVERHEKERMQRQAGLPPEQQDDINGRAGSVYQNARAMKEKYAAMQEYIRRQLNLTSLNYQRLEDLVKAIGLPKERLCTYCWDGAE